MYRVVFVFLTVVVCLSAVIAQEPVVEGEIDTPPVRQVEVVNFPDPHNVAGTVNVGNLPATQQVSGTVDVGNLPTDESGAVRVISQRMGIVMDLVDTDTPITHESIWLSPFIDTSSFEDVYLRVEAYLPTATYFFCRLHYQFTEDDFRVTGPVVNDRTSSSDPPRLAQKQAQGGVSGPLARVRCSGSPTPVTLQEVKMWLR